MIRRASVSIRAAIATVALFAAVLLRGAFVRTMRLVGVLELCRACRGAATVPHVRRSGKIKGRVRCNSCNGLGYWSRR